MTLHSNTHPESSLRLLLLVTVCILALTGCVETILIETPLPGSVEEGDVFVRISWDPTIDSTGLLITVNGTDVTGDFSFPDSSTAEASLSLIPGKKFLSVTMPNGPIWAMSASAIFTVTSTCPREEFVGGFLEFTCESSFFDLPISIPGLDAGLGLTDLLCEMLPISGVFPTGEAQLPKSTLLPVLFGVFPKIMTFTEDPEVKS